MNKLQSFTDLDSWRVGHMLVLGIYKVLKTFPKEEKYALSDQMRRAVVSVTSNIAEGFHRQSIKEKRQFYFMALGSLTEVQNQILIARDVDYLSKERFNELAELSVRVRKLVNGLIRSLKEN